MGCNGIRTSHNPPAPELLELCDRMGFIVMDESFDMWAKQKNKFDYHLNWKEWHRQDQLDQILRDRNHPSVFIWSVGNEIAEQWGVANDSSGKEILHELVSLVKSLDSTRPLVTANDKIIAGNQLLQANATELIGYNYHQAQWDSARYLWGNKPFIVTESVSALQTRGHYDMPSDSIRIWPAAWYLTLNNGNADTTCSAYDNCRTPWGSTHEESMKVLEGSDRISGMYIWTGFDYIGEPTPYKWPARSSYFGIVDLAGFPKDSYYMYQSVWTNKPVLHILPHWNWTKGQTIDVWAYYNNADEVELFLNGKSLGIKRKQADDLHVVWRTGFEPGTLKAVSRKNGKVVLTREIKTAGKPVAIELQADRNMISADGQDISFLTVKVVDKDGNLVPDADNLVNFQVEGEGSVIGVDNGSQTSMESFKASKRKAFNGLCLVVVQGRKKPGVIHVKASSDGLKSTSMNINSK
jgi:beta-galactosidase